MKTNFRLFLASLGASLALLGLWEWYLQRAYPSPYVSDPELEYRLRTTSPQGSGSIRFRERDYPLAAPPGVTRIIALGESTTWGSGLRSGEDAWPFRLEARLNEMPGRRVEVVNAGVNGWSCEHLRLAARRWLPLLRPGLVIVMTGWNWPGIGEPLSWTPLVRLPFGGPLAGLLRDSRLLTDLHFRFERLLSRPESPVRTMAEFERIRREHSARLETCVEALGRELSPYPAVLVKPAALFDAPGDPPALPEVKGLIGQFTFCPGRSPQQLSACHRLERETLRAGLSAAEASGRWRVVDGAQLAPADWDVRARLFMDPIHLTAAGNEDLAKLLAGELEGVTGVVAK